VRAHHRHYDAEILPAEVIGSIEHPRRRKNAKTPARLAGLLGFDQEGREPYRFHVRKFKLPPASDPLPTF
jgi:hypothetical protein